VVVAEKAMLTLPPQEQDKMGAQAVAVAGELDLAVAELLVKVIMAVQEMVIRVLAKQAEVVEVLEVLESATAIREMVAQERILILLGQLLLQQAQAVIMQVGAVQEQILQLLRVEQVEVEVADEVALLHLL
jgi:hypothetical protein